MLLESPIVDLADRQTSDLEVALLGAGEAVTARVNTER